MSWDAAFFAYSEIEPLIWDEDPGDHPLMANVPVFLRMRAARSAAGIVFATRRAEPSLTRIEDVVPTVPDGPVKIGVVRKGRRRAEVPLNLTA